MGFEIRWSGRGVCVRYERITSIAEIGLASAKVQADPRWSDVHYVLQDFSDCEGVDATDGWLDAVAAGDIGARITNPAACVALVTTRDDVRALIDAYRSLGVASFPHGVFTNVGDAMAWVGAYCASRFGPAR